MAEVLVGVQQREQARTPPALAAKHTEQLSAAGAVGAADRAQSGPECRVRTTAVATVAAAQSGTYACVRLLAGDFNGKHMVDDLKYVGTQRMTHRTDGSRLRIGSGYRPPGGGRLYWMAPSQVDEVGAGVPPSGEVPVGSFATGVARTPENDTHPAPSARWNQTSLFQGAVLVGYAGRP